MAEADRAELANFLWTIKGQFQQDPVGLAVKLAHICESLRSSGNVENQRMYHVVASALRTVVEVGNLDPLAISGAFVVRSQTEDGPITKPPRTDGVLQPANTRLQVTSVGASIPITANHERSVHPEPLRPVPRNFGAWGASMPSEAAGPSTSRATQQWQSLGRSERTAPGPQIQPHSAASSWGASSTQSSFFSTGTGPRASPSLQAQRAAFESQQAFLQSIQGVPRSPSLPHHPSPSAQARNHRTSLSPQSKGSLQQPASQYPDASVRRDPPNSSPSLSIPGMNHQPPLNSGVPISPHELPRPFAFERTQPRDSASSGVASPSAQPSTPLLPSGASAGGVPVPSDGSTLSRSGPDARVHAASPIKGPAVVGPGRSALQQSSGHPSQQAFQGRPTEKSSGTGDQLATDQSPVKAVPASAASSMPLEAVAESLREIVHQRAQAVLANGGNTNAELQRVAERVKELSEAGIVPECFQSEQKRQLIAQINIFQNVRYGKPSSQATVALALEDLKLLPTQSRMQGSESKQPAPSGGGVSAPGKKGKQPLTEEEKKERRREKQRERKREAKAKKANLLPSGPGKGDSAKECKSASEPQRAAADKGAAPGQHQKAAPTQRGTVQNKKIPEETLPRLRGLQLSSQTSKSSAPQTAGSFNSSKPFQQPKAPESMQPPVPPEPPDTRKPQFMTAWLSAEKRRSDAKTAKWSQLESKLDALVASKAAEVKDAEMHPSQDDCTARKVIDLKKLEVLALQQRLRKEVMDGFFAPAHAELQNVRQVKLQKSLRRIREAERKEQKLRDERARREKEKLKNFAKTLDQHKAFLAELQRAKKERVLRNNRAVVEFHKRKERAEREKKERLQREKIQALKSNDVEGYMKLVQDAKSDRVQQLLKETEAYIQALGQKLAAVTTQAREAEVGEGLAPTEPRFPESTEAAPASMLESNEKYYTVAHAVQEAVIEQPKMLVGGQLREYQMKGLQWMVSLHNNRLNGILADEMGLGKTIQVIGLLCYLMETKEVAGPFLIVVPSSVFSNWVSEIKRWAPSAVTVAYRGNPDTRRRIFSEQVAGRKFNILVTTYEFLMNKHDRPRLSKIRWAHLIIDEGHRIKNANCKLNTDLKQYSAKNRLLLTGTPIQNNLDELWTLLNFLLPDIFNSSDDFRQWFNKPFEGSGVEETEDQALLNEEENLLVINRLHQVLRPFMLRRMKEKVADELPGKVERLIRCESSAYQKLLAKQVTEKLGRLPGQSKGKAVQNTVMELRNICNHPFLSLLHVEEIEHSLDDAFLPAAVRLCGKLEMLDRILPKLKAGGHKVLFFCTMTRLLDIMEDYLVQKAYGYLRLDGATSGADRGTLIERFSAPDSSEFIFLLSLRAGGIGINLQAADTVIIYDTDWNPQVDLQAQARAHRIGQKRDVLVLRMETVNTVEEKIRARAEHKMGVATQSITAGFFDQSTSAEDRRDFLETILREANSDRQESADVPDDDQLNEMLARTPEEVELFAAEDRRRQQQDQARWRASKRSADAPAVLPRLITEAELEPVLKELEKADAEQSRSGSVGASEELGRGRRSQGLKRGGYADLTQRQFNYLLREGSLPPLVPKKRNRSEEKQTSEAKKQKKERKVSEEASSQGPTPTISGGTGDHVNSNRQGDQSGAIGHVALYWCASQAPPANGAVTEASGAPSAGQLPNGVVASPQVGAPAVPAVVASEHAPGNVLQSATTERLGIPAEGSVDAPPADKPSQPTAVGPTATEDSDEDIPLCALRLPPLRRAKTAAAVAHHPKLGPPHLQPEKERPRRGPEDRSPRQVLGAETSEAQTVQPPAREDLAPPSGASEVVREASPDASTVLPPVVELPLATDSELDRNGQFTSTHMPGDSSPGTVQTDPQAVGSSQAPPAALPGSSGDPAESLPAGKLDPLRDTESPPKPAPGPELSRTSEASDPTAANKLPLAADALPVGILDSGDARDSGVNKPDDVGNTAAAEPNTKIHEGPPNGSAREEGAQGQTVTGATHAGAMQVKRPHPVDSNGALGNGVTTNESSLNRSEVPRKGFKRRRTLCQTAEEAFEWSEEDLEEPSGGNRRGHSGQKEGASPDPSPPVPPNPLVPNGETVSKAGLLSGGSEGTAPRADHVSNGRPRSFSPSFASRPEVVRVSAAARGGLDGGEPWKQLRNEKMLFGAGPKATMHSEPKQGKPASSLPVSGQNPGARSPPTAGKGRAESWSPCRRADEVKERATPDSGVSEASLRAAQSAVGIFLDSMEEDGKNPCKRWLF